jgi:hypothetical protein
VRTAAVTRHGSLLWLPCGTACVSSASISAEQAACAWQCAHSLARSQLDYRRARLDIAVRSQIGQGRSHRRTVSRSAGALRGMGT